MARRSDPQLVLSFARPKRKKGGLEVDDYLELVERLRGDAMRVAKVFKLPGFDLDADRADARDRYGLCFSDGRIRIRLVHVRTGHSLKYSALIDTVVHELAHLRYMDHGPRWEALYGRMLEWCRKQGIYEPRPVGVPREKMQRPPASPRAEQLALFPPPRTRSRRAAKNNEAATSHGAATVRERVAPAPPSSDQLAEFAQNVLSAITKG